MAPGIPIRGIQPPTDSTLGPRPSAWSAALVALAILCVSGHATAQQNNNRQLSPPPDAGFTDRADTGTDATDAPAESGDATDPPDTMRSTTPTGDPDSTVRSEPVIGRMSLTCDIDICTVPTTSNKFLDLAGLYVGQRWTASVRNAARSRLEKTGFFETLTFDVDVLDSRAGQPQRIALTVNATGATLIRNIRIEGAKPPPFKSELRKLLLFREGEAYAGDESKISAQLNSLEGLFREEGFFGTSVTFDAQPVDGEPKLVDLTLTVDKGERLEICHIGVRGLRSLSYREARTALLSGVSVFTRRLDLLPPKYTTEVFKKGRQALMETYRDRGFLQARIVDYHAETNIDEGCANILVEVDEGPKWSVAFEGNDVFGSEQLRSELPFDETGYVDEEAIRRAERSIEEAYETRGYPLAEVEAEESREDRLNRTLTFRVQEGERLEVAGIRFHGVSNLDPSRLRDVMETRPFRLFESGGYLQTERLLADLRSLEDEYRSAGYLGAAVTRYELSVDRDDSELIVHVYIDEGTRTTVSSVDLTGVRSVSSAKIRNRLSVQTDGPYNPLNVRADSSRIQQQYASVGYPLASVSTACQTQFGQDIPCRQPELPARCVANSRERIERRCTWQGEARTTLRCERVLDDASCRTDGPLDQQEQVRVTHAVDEGPRVTVGEILLRGNFETNASVIYREIPLQPGDIFDTQKILQGQGNLRSLGIFDSVSIEAIGLDDAARDRTEHQASLLVTVEESRNRFLDFRVGLEGRDLLGEQTRLLSTVEVGYTNDNFLGRAWRLEPRLFGAVDTLQFGRLATSATRRDTDPRVGQVDYLAGAELVYRNPRFLKESTGIDKLLLTVVPFYLIDLVGVSNDRLLREEWGVRMEVRKELTELLDRLFVSLGLEGKQAATTVREGPRRNGRRLFSPRRITGTLIPEISLDRRDSPLNPSDGFLLRLRPELVSGDALSREVQAIQDSFLRLRVSGDAYLPIGDKLVVGQRLTYGHVVPFFGRDTPVPQDERFFLGGASSLRGYPANSLGPQRAGDPSGGELRMNYSLELRYPLIPGIDLQGATFFDAGLLADCFADNGSTRRVGCWSDVLDSPRPRESIRTAAGIGFRYIVADQIPLLLDYGLALDRLQNESYGSLHFNLGYTF